MAAAKANTSGSGFVGGTGHVAAVRKQVGRPPEQPHPGVFHLSEKIVRDLVQARGVFHEVGAFGADIRVVEAEEGHAENAEHLESGNLP